MTSDLKIGSTGKVSEAFCCRSFHYFQWLAAFHEVGQIAQAVELQFTLGNWCDFQFAPCPRLSGNVDSFSLHR